MAAPPTREEEPHDIEVPSDDDDNDIPSFCQLRQREEDCRAGAGGGAPPGVVPEDVGTRPAGKGGGSAGGGKDAQGPWPRVVTPDDR